MRTLREYMAEKLKCKTEEVIYQPAENAGAVMWGIGLLDWPVIEPPAPGGPCYVVTKEAWERFVCSYDDIGCNTKDEVLALFRDEANSHWMEQAEEHWKAAEASASVVATALLGSVRMAKAVTRWAGGYRLVDDFKQEDMVEVHDGDTVAVLEDK